MAAERADSIGIDMISSSLGYTTFDDNMFNHTYNELNGMGTIVSKAASMAVSKGMIVSSSAGNEGDNPWKYISAPADGKMCWLWEQSTVLVRLRLSPDMVRLQMEESSQMLFPLDSIRN